MIFFDTKHGRQIAINRTEVQVLLDTFIVKFHTVKDWVRVCILWN